MPQFSFIIATLNASPTLARCLESLYAQRGVTFEIVIVDGGSSDGTVAIAGDYGARILACEQPGIYPALNLGIEVATGDWVAILGADDALIGDHTLARLWPRLEAEQHRLHYCQSIQTGCGSSAKLLGRSWLESASSFRSRQCIPHGSTFYPRALLKKFPFSEAYTVAGDYDQLARIVKIAAPVFHEFPTTKVATGGVSTNWRHFFTSVRESSRIARTYFPEEKSRLLRFTVHGLLWRLWVAIKNLCSRPRVFFDNRSVRRKLI